MFNRLGHRTDTRASRRHWGRRGRPRLEVTALESRQLLTDSSVGGLAETLRADWGGGLPGAPAQLTMTARPTTDVTQLNVTIRGEGVFAGADRSTTLIGPWLFAPASLSFTASPTGLGSGHLGVAVEARDAAGHVTAVDRADVFALYDGTQVWSSPSSMIDLQDHRLTALLASGAIDTTAYQAGRDALITANTATTVRRVDAPVGSLAAPSAHALATTAATVNLSGKAQWTDGAGGTHPVPRAPVEIYESDGANITLLAKAVTSRQGEYSLDVNPAAGSSSIFVRVLARSAYGDVQPEIVGTTTYKMQSSVLPLTGASSLTVDLTADNATDAGRAFAVDAAMEMVGTYAASLLGKSLPLLPTYYPEIPKAGEPASGISQFSSAAMAMFVRGTAWNQFDVTDHEYGHYIADSVGFDQSPGGMHSSKQNLIPAYGSPNGEKLAWSEGWATYFSLSGQISGGYGALSIPTVADHTYDGLSSYSIDTLNADGRALGEDNEGSVQGALWNMWLTGQSAVSGSTLSYTDKTIFDIINSAKPTTIGAFWEAAAAKLDNQGKARLGQIFSDMNIAPTPMEPADNFDARTATTPPTFKWKNHGAGTANPNNDFVVKFFSADWKREIFTSPASEPTVGAATSTWTPTDDEWKTITAGGKGMHWLVAGKNSTTGTPGGALGRYWSPAQTINGGIQLAFVIDTTGSMSEEIGGVRAALQSFIDSLASLLPAGAAVPVMELITFVNAPNVVAITDDLTAMRSAIGGLGAGGGGDCPEPSAVSLQRAINDLAPGGTILLVTDASTDPGVDLSGLIAQARAKGITVNAEISGDCSGIDSEGGGDGSSIAASFLASALTRAEVSADVSDTDGDCGCGGAGGCNDDATATETTLIGLPPEASPRIETTAVVRAGGNQAEPGGGTSEPPGGPITVTFGPPDDPNGGTIATATPLRLGPSPVRGYVPRPDQDADVFVVSLRKGLRYAIDIHGEAGGVPLVDLIGTDGTTPIFTVAATRNLESGETLNRYIIPFEPSATGNYFIRVRGYDPSNPTSFRIAVKEDPLAAVVSSIDGFSSVAFQTGGTFNVRDSVKRGDSETYIADVFNIIMSTVTPTVIVASPGVLPQGETLRVSLTARGTSWRQGATNVQFSAAGLHVLDVNVTSPTTLSALVQVDPDTILGSYNVNVTTTLGTGTVTSSGRNVVKVGGPISAATLLSVETNTLQRGQTVDIQLRGAKTAWDATSVLTLGPGVKINGFTVMSPTLINASVTVDPAASIGFRTAAVTTGSHADSQTRSLFVGIGALSSVPTIVSLSPATAGLGETVTVNVVATGTHFQPGLTTAQFGAGVTVTSLTVSDGTHANVTVRVAPSAMLGFRDVVLTTGVESAALLNGFFVDSSTGGSGGNPDAPAIADVSRVGYHAQPTVLTITYSTAMNAAVAGDARYYTVYDLGAGYHPGARPIRVVKVNVAGYDPSTHAVQLATRHRLPLRHLFKLVIQTGPAGVTGENGAALVGATIGPKGTTASVLFGPEALKNGPRLTLGPRDPWAGKPVAVHHATHHPVPRAMPHPRRSK